MRICIPTENKEGLSARVYEHFGSTPYFTIYDTENETFKIVDNINAHHSHGMCHPIGVLGTSSIDVVVCQGMGMRAVQKLNEANIKAYKAVAGTVDEIIKGYKGNELEELTVQNACAQHGCH
ncbi:MAG: NifB/NifX family molybdenum-iron cluster-binding protein [Candidatus Omnitrophica bacterium]|jgi:predicted Fe-Mo cluster-binding NifX family protein|nr:NifB/NifX family molybdenum-iron cluster-binding protein [Candidatus Omnitrophota bacterium]